MGRQWRERIRTGCVRGPSCTRRRPGATARRVGCLRRNRGSYRKWASKSAAGRWAAAEGQARQASLPPSGFVGGRRDAGVAHARSHATSRRQARVAGSLVEQLRSALPREETHHQRSNKPRSTAAITTVWHRRSPNALPRNGRRLLRFGAFRSVSESSRIGCRRRIPAVRTKAHCFTMMKGLE